MHHTLILLTLAMDYYFLTGASISDMVGSKRNAASCLGSQSGVMLSARGRLKYRDLFCDSLGHSFMMWQVKQIFKDANIYWVM